MKMTDYFYDKETRQSFAVIDGNEIPFSEIKQAFLPSSKVEITNKGGVYYIENAESKFKYRKFKAVFAKKEEYILVHLSLKLENGFKDSVNFFRKLRLNKIDVSTLRKDNKVEFEYDFDVVLYLYEHKMGSLLSATFDEHVDDGLLEALVDWKVYLDDYIDQAKDVVKLLSSIYLQTKTISLYNKWGHTDGKLRVDYQEDFIVKIFDYVCRKPSNFINVSSLLNQIIAEIGGDKNTANHILSYIENVVLSPDSKAPCFNYDGWHMSLKFFREGVILFFSKDNIYAPIVFLHSAAKYDYHTIDTNIKLKTSLKKGADIKKYFCITNGKKDGNHSYYNCSVIYEDKCCKSENCGIKLNIEDFTNTINEDARNWNENYPYLVHRNEIDSNWRKLRPDVYGLFSMRKSGKSTTIKAILGFETFLYINLAEGAWEYRQPGELTQKITNADVSIFKECKYFDYNLEEYFKYIFSIFEGSINSRSIVIDECERIFKHLCELPEVAEKSLMFLSSLACNSKVILCGQDRTYIDNLLPYDNPINSMKELKLELFSKDETYELLDKITKDKFVLSDHLMENIYNATSGHPRLIVNIIIRLIKMLSKYKVPLNATIDMDYIKKTLSSNNANFRTYFDWESVIKPLNYYQELKLYQESKENDLANLLHNVFLLFKRQYPNIKVYSASNVIPEEVFLEDGNISTENLDYLTALNFLVLNANNEYFIKIPLLFNIFNDNGSLYDYLDN